MPTAPDTRAQGDRDFDDRAAELDGLTEAEFARRYPYLAQPLTWAMPVLPAS